jgi:hypothetical protein
MKHRSWIPATQLAILAIVLVTGTPRSHGGTVAEALSPLQRPDLANARLAVDNLLGLAGKQPVDEKLRSQRLAASIKGVFTAEFRIQQFFKTAEPQEAEIRRLERSAHDWMIPNSFGTVNEVGAREALFKAKEIRTKLEIQLAEEQEKLVVELKEVDGLLHSFFKLQDYETVVVLAGAADSVARRSLPEDGFSLSFNGEALIALREFIRLREDWLLAAKNAEQSSNHEEAIRLYTKARDQAGKSRCAAALAAQLEKADLPGSAIDYYEIAGNSDRAAALRREHPNLTADAFKKLNAEQLYAKVAPSCVRVSTETGHGTGFFIRRGGYVITNKHVIAGAKKVVVKLDDSRSFDAEVLAQGADLDLAILKIQFEDHEFLRFQTPDNVRIGTPATLVGYPERDLPTSTMNSGQISNINRVFRNHPVYQLDLSANHGNSGGPVVDELGKVIGILTFGLGEMKIDRFNFAIRSEIVQAFIDEKLPK